jgi:hypothetical protein
MDDVRYEHRQPRGMRLTMTKKRTAPGSAAGQKGERADPGCQCAGPGGGAGGDGGGPAPRAAKEGGLG